MGELTFYFDRCFGKRFPEAVERLRPPFQVKSHFGMNFKDNTPDDEWLRVVGANKWIVLSHDAKFHFETPALEAIRQFDIGCFYLWGAQMPVWDKVALLTRVFPRMAKIASSEKRPYIYQATKDGRVLLVRHWDGRKEPKKYRRAEEKLRAGRPGA